MKTKLLTMLLLIALITVTSKLSFAKGSGEDGAGMDSGAGHSIYGMLLDEAEFGHLVSFKIKEVDGYELFVVPLLDEIFEKSPLFAEDLKQALEKDWVNDHQGLSLSDCPNPETALQGKLSLVACQNKDEVKISNAEFFECGHCSPEFRGKVIIHELIRGIAINLKKDIPEIDVRKMYNNVVNIAAKSAISFLKQAEKLGFGEYDVRNKECVIFDGNLEPYEKEILIKKNYILSDRNWFLKFERTENFSHSIYKGYDKGGYHYYYRPEYEMQNDEESTVLKRFKGRSKFVSTGSGVSVKYWKKLLNKVPKCKLYR